MPGQDRRCSPSAARKSSGRCIGSSGTLRTGEWWCRQGNDAAPGWPPEPPARQHPRLLSHRTAKPPTTAPTTPIAADPGQDINLGGSGIVAHAFLLRRRCSGNVYSGLCNAFPRPAAPLRRNLSNSAQNRPRRAAHGGYVRRNHTIAGQPTVVRVTSDRLGASRMVRGYGGG